MRTHIKTLYKYVRDPNLFLGEFYIRATQISALNDPFEARFSKEGVEEAGSHYDLPIYPCNFEIEKHRVGVVCLSESKDNLLMWSHYANEHKGCVLGFTVAPQDSRHNIYNSFRFFENYTGESCSSFDGNFYPVAYRKQQRYKNDILECAAGDGVDNERIFIQEVFQVKSDEWMYEKEHRAILPLAGADKIVIPIELLENFKSWFSEELDNNFCDINSDQKSIEFHMTKMEPEKRKDVGEFFSYNSKDPRVLFLFKVSKLCLNSITFGCNCGPVDLLEPEEEYFGNVYPRIYQAVTSDKYFALEFNQIELDRE